MLEPAAVSFVLFAPILLLATSHGCRLKGLAHIVSNRPASAIVFLDKASNVPFWIEEHSENYHEHSQIFH